MKGTFLLRFCPCYFTSVKGRNLSSYSTLNNENTTWLKTHITLLWYLRRIVTTKGHNHYSPSRVFAMESSCYTISRGADFATKALIWRKKPMTKPKRFDIIFDAQEEVYFSEQIVSGNVILEIAEPLNLKGVKLRFKGECSIHFSETKKIIRKVKKGDKKRKKLEENEKEMEEIVEFSKKPEIANGYCMYNGVDNPGYIPDEKKTKDPKTYRGLNGLHSNPYMCKKLQKCRPTSTQSNSWSDGVVRGPRQHFQAVETFFDCEFYIYGHKYQKDEKESLPAGIHDFPFAFNLPPNLPPSFSSEKGIIRYIVAAILDRPAAANIVRKAGFSVLSILDLNLNSQATSSCSKSETINPCGLCCDKGPITLSMHIARRGYVPGESIRVWAELDNISGRHTKGTNLTLLQVITYIMPNDLKTHRVERIVKQVVRGALAPGNSDFWEDVYILVPPIVPGNLHIHSRLMHVEYKLEMVVALPKPWKDLRVSMPIIIGNIPLRSTFSSFLPPTETYVPPNELPRIKYPNFPPFIYGKCFFGEEILEKQYERITLDPEYMGPPFVKETPYAPTYLLYTPGNNILDRSSLSFESSSMMS